MARVFALLLLLLLAWGVIYAVLGEDSAPGGQLFDIAVLCICAHIGGWIFRMLAMPGLAGMLMVGILFQNVGLINVHGGYNLVVREIRKFALVIILTRAGLDLDSEAMKRLWSQVLKIGLVPWLVECAIAVIFSHYALGLPWIWGVLLGSILAAVSPAVVVPCLFRLRNKGYGVAKGIPTLIIAVAGMDDAASVAAFGIIQGVMFSSDSPAYEIIMGFVSIGAGILFGIAWGLLASYVPEKQDPFVVPLRILMLLGGGLIAVLGSELVGFGGAGPLGCIAAAFLSVYAWSKQGWDVEDVSTLVLDNIVISALSPHEALDSFSRFPANFSKQHKGLLDKQMRARVGQGGILWVGGISDAGSLSQYTHSRVYLGTECIYHVEGVLSVKCDP